MDSGIENPDHQLPGRIRTQLRRDHHGRDEEWHQEFPGTGQWTHRHEEFNADSWANHTVPYRYNVETYSLGGPVFIPKHWNQDRKRLFFFWSQEYTAQFVSGGSESMHTPTALERQGDFSKSFNNNGSLVSVLDPSNNNAPFPGNVIPANRINSVGQQLLNFFPCRTIRPRCRRR